MMRYTMTQINKIKEKLLIIVADLPRLRCEESKSIIQDIYTLSKIVSRYSASSISIDGRVFYQNHYDEIITRSMYSLKLLERLAINRSADPVLIRAITVSGQLFYGAKTWNGLRYYGASENYRPKLNSVLVYVSDDQQLCVEFHTPEKAHDFVALFESARIPREHIKAGNAQFYPNNSYGLTPIRFLNRSNRVYFPSYRTEKGEYAVNFVSSKNVQQFVDFLGIQDFRELADRLIYQDSDGKRHHATCNYRVEYSSCDNLLFTRYPHTTPRTLYFNPTHVLFTSQNYLLFDLISRNMQVCSANKDNSIDEQNDARSLVEALNQEIIPVQGIRVVVKSPIQTQPSEDVKLISINANYQDKTLRPMELNPKDSLETLKRKIASQIDLPIEHFEIHLGSEEGRLIQDEDEFSSILVRGGDTLNLSISLKEITLHLVCGEHTFDRHYDYSTLTFSKLMSRLKTMFQRSDDEIGIQVKYNDEGEIVSIDEAGEIVSIDDAGDFQLILSELNTGETLNINIDLKPRLNVELEPATSSNVSGLFVKVPAHPIEQPASVPFSPHVT